MSRRINAINYLLQSCESDDRRTTNVQQLITAKSLTRYRSAKHQILHFRLSARIKRALDNEHECNRQS